MSRNKKGIYRDSSKRILGGVCSGLSYYLGVDRVLIRLGFVACVFILGFTIPLYIILWAIMPKARTDKEKAEMMGGDYDVESESFNSKTDERGFPSSKRREEHKATQMSPSISRLFNILIISFCSIGLLLIIGFSFGIPLFLDFFRDIELGVINSLKKPLLGIMIGEKALSIGAISTLGKFGIPFIAGIAYGLKNLEKTDVSKKVFNYLGITWAFCILISYFFS